MRILWFSHDCPDRKRISMWLRELATAADIVASQEEAEAAISIGNYDVVVLDLSSTVRRTISEMLVHIAQNGHFSTLVIAERAQINSLSDAIRQGADDFLVQPIDFEELKLRLQCTLAHRHQNGSSNSLTIECGPLRLDLDTNEIFLEDAYLDLTPRERGVLSVLMKNCNKVTSKDQIAGQIFTLDEQVETRTIETYVYRLRKKLAHPELELATMRGLGYRLSSKSSSTT